MRSPAMKPRLCSTRNMAWASLSAKASETSAKPRSSTVAARQAGGIGLSGNIRASLSQGPEKASSKEAPPESSASITAWLQSRGVAATLPLGAWLHLPAAVQADLRGKAEAGRESEQGEDFRG